MFKPGKRHVPARSGLGARLLTCLVAPWALTAAGCGFWDDFRAYDYSVKGYFFTKEDPIKVLQNSTDGTKRARALGKLKEPVRNGGTEHDQEFVVTLLVKAATEDTQPWCRLQAIKTLSTFKDPRAVKGLEDAYYRADGSRRDQADTTPGQLQGFPAEIATVLRIQAINGLGQIGDPKGVDVIVNTLKAPRLDARSEAEKQLNLDERLAAAAALANFKNSRATEALVQVLKSEKDVALRDRAHQSLQAATGKRLAPDATAWENLIYGDGAPLLADKEKDRTQMLPPIIPAGATERAPR